MANEPMLTKFTPHMYFGPTCGREKYWKLWTSPNLDINCKKLVLNILQKRDWRIIILKIHVKNRMHVSLCCIYLNFTKIGHRVLYNLVYNLFPRNVPFTCVNSVFCKILALVSKLLTIFWFKPYMCFESTIYTRKNTVIQKILKNNP